MVMKQVLLVVSACLQKRWKKTIYQKLMYGNLVEMCIFIHISICVYITDIYVWLRFGDIWPWELVLYFLNQKIARNLKNG